MKESSMAQDDEHLKLLMGYVKGERREREIWKPTPEPLWKPIVSVDDHLLEPPTTFEGRMPAALADKAPHVIEDEEGMQFWMMENDKLPILGSNGVVSWEPENWYIGPVRYDELSPGMYDINARVKDMDIVGCAASLCFPSMLFGFAGQRFMRMTDQELGLASLRAWNQWHIEEWAGTHPGRIIPQQLAWLSDPVIAAEEIYKNAALGFRAVAFTENPEKLGLPHIYSDHWDPFFRACEETETVINLHVGSSSSTIMPCSASPLDAGSALFPLNAMIYAVDWLYALIPLRFPNLKICWSESGLGWVPMLLDRLDYNMKKTMMDAWPTKEISPSEAFRRNFWLSSFYDPSALKQRDYIGINRIMFEIDFPHPDTTWPTTQGVLRELVAGIPDDEVDAMLYGTACELYRHPLPAGASAAHVA
jgi:predicted TIM-barrel fold metal-dependent hydrolase